MPVTSGEGGDRAGGQKSGQAGHTRKKMSAADHVSRHRPSPISRHHRMRDAEKFSVKKFEVI